MVAMVDGTPCYELPARKGEMVNELVLSDPTPGRLENGSLWFLSLSTLGFATRTTLTRLEHGEGYLSRAISWDTPF